MKRLLRFVVMIMVAMTVLMPLLECFDRWDRPGLSHDSEFPLVLVTFFIALVIVVAVAIARRMMTRQNAQTETDIVYEFVRSAFGFWTDITVSPFVFPPLRI